MATYIDEETIDRMLSEIKQQFGKPPVLSWEDIDAYYKIMRGFLTCFSPLDYFTQNLVREMTDATWEALRNGRHKTVAIDRRFRQSLEFQKKRQKLIEVRQELQKKTADERKELLEKGELTLGLRRIELEWVLNETAEEVDEFLEQTANEFDQSRALESAINFFEQLDELQGNALKRRNDIIEQLERYREAQPKWVADEAMNDFLDAQFEADQAKSLAASLVPTSGQNR